ncbi:unnamed protein product [Brachionus calyciflorus]|uniref:Sperm-associated antigen 17 n=1 Tax=Brachionus calyciflorus TaxID=104777 RepID=A0A813Y7A8_9BILA|nr:unnamed protein product [Brachionus calyciflorus]
MGPKRKSPNRSKSPKKAENADLSFFQTPLYDDEWNALIVMINPTDASEELYLEQLEKSVRSNCRRRFTWLSKKDIIDLINESTNKKGVASPKKSASIQVPLPPVLITTLETARQFIDNKEEIPDSLLCQILKGKLIHIKMIEKEKEVSRLGRQTVKQTGVKTAQTAGKKDKSPGRKSPTKTKKTNAGPLPEIEKQSQLKKKEDIEEEEKYLDDEPKDGPNHYIILSGFYSANIFSQMDDFLIPLDCLIKFKALNKNLIENFMFEIEDRERLETNLKANLKVLNETEKPSQVNVEKLSEERRDYLSKVKIELEKFWSEATLLLEKPQDKLIQHIARLKISVKQDPTFKSWFDLEARTDFGMKLFDHLAEKCYSLVIQKRQYNFYINNLKLYSIPPSSKILTYPPSQSIIEDPEPEKLYDTRHYNDLLNSIPSEYLSPALIVYSMVEQVALNSEEENSVVDGDKKSESNMTHVQNLSPEVTNYFGNVIENLALTEVEKHKLVNLLPSHKKEETTTTKTNSKKSSITPTLVNFNDEISQRLKGVFEDVTQKKTKKFSKLPFDPLQVELDMLSKSLFTEFTGVPKVPAKVAKERAARLQELLHFLTSSPEITNADVDRALKQFVFETMNLTETNRKSFVKKSNQNSVIPWDDQYPNISETLSEEQQVMLKSLNLMEKKEMSNSDLKKKKEIRVSSASTNRSIKFQDEVNSESTANKESSVPSSILKSRPSTKLSVQSVHFPDTFDLNPNNESLNDIIQPKTIDESVELINNTRKRDLTEWVYAEHYDPKTLVQILAQTNYTHPYVDSYYNRRDDSLMLVFSNPCDETTLSNHEECTVKLHSNVGFRNYLEKIYDMIMEWTRDEEAKYQAGLVKKEVDRFSNESSESFQKDRTIVSRSTSPSKKRTPSPKDKKKASVAQNVPVSIPNESEYISSNFISHNSLKAWKMEQDRQAEAASKLQPKAKSPRGKSPKAKSKSPDSKKDKKTSSKSPTGSRAGSAKSKKSTSRSNSKSKMDNEKPPATPISVQKANESFIGYQIGNNMIYVKSHLSHMFPYSGALIKTERVNLKTESNLFVTSSVIKDGNTYSVHLVDPKLDENNNEANAKIADYTCFTSVFKDGLSLAVSTPINYQDLKKIVKIEPTPTAPSPTQLLAQQQALQQQQQIEDQKQSKKTAQNKKGKKGDATPEPKKEEKKEEIPLPEVIEAKEETPKIAVLPWTQLNISCPNGLSCTFLPETYTGVQPLRDNEPHRLVVKQKYTQKCDEKAGEHFKNFNHNILKEKSRMIKSDGTVIKFFVDGSFEVLYPNGTIYRKIIETLQENDLETFEIFEQKQKNKKKESQKLDEPIHPHFETKTQIKYYVTTQSGNEYLINKDEENSFKLEKFYRNLKATDSQSHEVLLTREDNLRMVLRPDGSSLVDFSDGTRITTFFVQQSQENTKRDKFVKVECPGYATTIFNVKTSECTLVFGNNGSIVCCDPFRVNYSVMHGNGEIVDINKDASVYVTHKNGPQLAKNKFCFRQNSDIILEHEDEIGNKFKVNKNGKNIIFNVSQGSVKEGNNIKSYGKHAPRFFIVHKDSSGTELLRAEDVSDYLADVEVDPMTAIIRDNIQGYPNIMGTTVLRPLRNCLTDAWMCEYDEKEIIPPGLRCRNLQTFPSNPEVKVHGANFGTNAGRGISVDLNPSRRVKNPPITIAKRMEYRQLIEYQKLSDEVKLKLMTGLKNYMAYIAKRAENHRLLLTYDPRNEVERLTLSKILQITRSDHLLNADISQMYKKALSKNTTEYIGKDLKSLNKLLVKPKTNEKNKKLENEIEIEKKNRHAWRRGFVPSYFDSEWGQEFLSKLQQPQSNKENSFLKIASENDFTQMSNNNHTTTRTTTNQQDSSIQNKQKPMDKKYFPPMSYLETEFSSEKKATTVSAPFERYQPQFKFVNKLDPKKLPNSIKTTRPNAVPNELFLSNEENVRRKVNNSIVNAATMNGRSLDKRRGLEVYPKEIKFGILREGFTYVTEFELINVGIDACRFKIKQPPPETGLKIMYKPGPIAAGMNRDLSVVLLGIFTLSEEDMSEQVYPKIRKLRHDLEITTETDVIRVPIEAEIASIEEFRAMFRGNLEAGKEKNVRIMSVRPGSTKQVLTKPFNLQNNNNNNNINEDIRNSRLS